MSILIKGMEMPKCCADCWALDDYGDYPRCRITGEQHGYSFRFREYRMPDCPLVPVPPHGRLINADALKAHYSWWAGGTEEHTLDEMKSLFDTIIDLQPTIADEEVAGDG